MARQYTTPQETIRVSGVDLTGANIYVTYSDRARAKSITITNVTVTKDGDDSVLTLSLTEEQTGMFEANEKVSVQVNWKATGKRYATEIANVQWNENLIKEVLE